MGLESEYTKLDIIPTGFPFTGLQRARTCVDLYPSSTWRSHNKSAYARSFRPRTPQEPKTPLRPVIGNNPQGTAAYTIWKIDHKPVCDVTSRSDGPHIPMPTPRSEAHSRFDSSALFPKCLVEKFSPRTLPPAIGIIPGSGLAKEFEERMLPAVPRETTNKMSSMPLLNYSGAKKKIGAPYKDGGILYDEARTNPSDKENYWHSVSSLTGKHFSRRKNVYGPNDSLHVKGFDGGANREYNKDGIRCGYKQRFSTGVRDATNYSTGVKDATNYSTGVKDATNYAKT